MYHYTLLKYNDGDLTVIEPTQEVETLAALQALIEEHIGMCPDWLKDTSRDQYLQEEDEQGDFILDIEGAEVM